MTCPHVLRWCVYVCVCVCVCVRACAWLDVSCLRPHAQQELLELLPDCMTLLEYAKKGGEARLVEELGALSPNLYSVRACVLCCVELLCVCALRSSAECAECAVAFSLLVIHDWRRSHTHWLSSSCGSHCLTRAWRAWMAWTSLRYKTGFCRTTLRNRSKLCVCTITLSRASLGRVMSKWSYGNTFRDKTPQMQHS